MTKKTEVKAKAKGSDAEKKVVAKTKSAVVEKTHQQWQPWASLRPGWHHQGIRAPWPKGSQRQRAARIWSRPQWRRGLGGQYRKRRSRKGQRERRASQQTPPRSWSPPCRNGCSRA